jgi:hypothetical protein
LQSCKLLLLQKRVIIIATMAVGMAAGIIVAAGIIITTTDIGSSRELDAGRPRIIHLCDTKQAIV